MDLLHSKSEVLNTFQKIYNMIHVQFGKSIKTIWSDPAIQEENTYLVNSPFYLKIEFFIRSKMSSYSTTEWDSRKINILETICALLVESSVPHKVVNSIPVPVSI